MIFTVLSINLEVMRDVKFCVRVLREWMITEWTRKNYLSQTVISFETQLSREGTSLKHILLRGFGNQEVSKILAFRIR
jgi:hypothetical protein